MSKLIRGLVVPLFDRLSQDEFGSQGHYLETKQAMKMSIERELHRLFNTRSPLSLTDFENGDGTVLEYGIPDFSSADVQRGADWERLRRALTLAVERFEPRLCNVSVRFDGSSSKIDSLKFNIVSEVKAGIELKRMDFQVFVDPSTNRLVESS